MENVDYTLRTTFASRYLTATNTPMYKTDGEKVSVCAFSNLQSCLSILDQDLISAVIFNTKNGKTNVCLKLTSLNSFPPEIFVKESVKVVCEVVAVVKSYSSTVRK